MVAILLVHTNLGQFRDGFIGVDVFFVLSGFLITSLLLREHRLTGGIGFKRFYVRRVLRLYPALVVAALGIVALAWLAHAEEPDRLAVSAVASLVYVGNMAYYSGHGTALFSHTWSLALEEQFYLVWPAMVLLLVNARRPLRIVLVSAIASFWIVLALVLPMPEHAGINSVLHTYVRAVGLPVGAVLAFALARPGWSDRLPRALIRASAAVAATLLAAIVLWPIAPAGLFDDADLSLAALLALPVVAGAVVETNSRLAQLLSHRVLRYLGSRSYAIYLWHFPLVSLSERLVDVPRGIRVAGAYAVTLLLAEVSWRVVETPFLRLKARFASSAGVRRQPEVALPRAPALES